jgi:hypothetical protein
VARQHDPIPQLSNWIKAAKEGRVMPPAPEPGVESAEATDAAFVPVVALRAPETAGADAACIEIVAGSVLVRVPLEHFLPLRRASDCWTVAMTTVACDFLVAAINGSVAASLLRMHGLQVDPHAPGTRYATVARCKKPRQGGRGFSLMSNVP